MSTPHKSRLTQPSPSDVMACDNPAHIEAHSFSSAKPLSAAALSTQLKETDYDIQNYQIARWEDEGGAHITSATRIFRNSRIGEASPLSSHIRAAEDLLMAGDYDAAYAELEAAAIRYEAYKMRIKTIFNQSIARLTTLNCNASPPHPKSVPLIKLRQKITS